MSASKATYLDSSALVKLAVREPESAALRRYLRVGGRSSSVPSPEPRSRGHCCRLERKRPDVAMTSSLAST
jgi:predicted nucleic acid-binding protein